MVLAGAMDDLNAIPVKAFHDRDMICVNIDRGMTVGELSMYVKDLFKFIPTQDLTLKWVDEEGDPCSISSQEELNEAIRLFDVNRESQLIIHVFRGTPDEPGKLCEGETNNRDLEHPGRRWRSELQHSRDQRLLTSYWYLSWTTQPEQKDGKPFVSIKHCQTITVAMVGKDEDGNSSGSIKSGISVTLRRHSEGVGDVEFSPTFPNSWKSFQYLGRKDSRRAKRYTVGCFPSPGFAGGSHLPSAEEIDQLTSYLSKETADLPKRSRFSSGYILGLFAKRQSSVVESLPKDKKSSTNNCNEKRRIQKINSAPNFSKSTSNTTGNIYRRGARRWRKIYKINGHSFVARRFSRLAQCEYCSDIIWGLGRQGYKCLDCRIIVHKKCHRLLRHDCEETRKQKSLLSSSLPPINAVGTKLGKEHDNTAGVKRTKSDSPQHHRKALVPSAYNNFGPSKLSINANHVNVTHFDFIRVIGRGSYAKVLYVNHKKTGRKYAMKVVKKELVNDDEDIDWVQTEKHVFEQASNHPFLVGLHSCFQTASRLFFVIEFVAGGDLMFHMQNQRRLPEDHARFYSAEIACALNFLHENGIIYRDLKLDNVLLDKDGHVKITDYGMCKEGLRPGDKTGTFCGTPNYIAPEVLRGEDYGLSVDWWATGVLLFEMLAGRSPFDIVGHADNPDQNTEDYLFQVILEKSIRIPRSLSVKAASILKGFLNKNPEERLGCHPQTGFADIQSHLFFRAIDWRLLEARQITPPFKPRVEDGQEVENFDPQFTAEPVQLTPDDPKLLDTIDQSEFEGFEYVNPLLTSAEEAV